MPSRHPGRHPGRPPQRPADGQRPVKDAGPIEAPWPTPDEIDAIQTCAGVSRETLERLQDYAERLAQWQRRINLIGPATMPEVWHRHILDSAQLWPLIKSANGPVLDIGSGAGFPGLVLGLISADLDGPMVHLVESDGRKAAFLADVAARIGARITLHHARVEALSPWPCAVVTARACASVSQILTFSAPFLGPESQVILLKGQRAQSELTDASEYWRFSARSMTSQTDPTGEILCLSGIAPKPSAAD